MEHHFDVDIAKEFGINAAIILYNINYWITKNEANGVHFQDGNTWTYNSVRAFAELMPYLSEKQIRSAIKLLVEKGIIIEGNYNASSYDRTSWYALTEKGKCILQKGKMDIAKRENGSAEKGKCILQIINTDSKPNNDICAQAAKPPAQKPVKHKYGEYNNVLLSDEEIEKLKAEISNVSDYIERLSSYIASTGKAYKSHYATIRNWYRKDGAEKKAQDPMNDPDAYNFDWDEIRKRFG